MEYPDGIARHEAEQSTTQQDCAAESFVPLLPSQQVAYLEKLWWLSYETD